jgi:uncharacterized membrane protein YqiK
MGVLFGAQRIYQAGFQAAAQEAQVRELQAKEQARAMSAKLIQAQMYKHKRIDHEILSGPSINDVYSELDA